VGATRCTTIVPLDWRKAAIQALLCYCSGKQSPGESFDPPEKCRVSYHSPTKGLRLKWRCAENHRDRTMRACTGSWRDPLYWRLCLVECH
jgi:hypothetical protein